MRFEDTVSRLQASGFPFVVHEHDVQLTMEAVAESGLFDMDKGLKTMLFDASGTVVAAVLLGSDKVDYKGVGGLAGVRHRDLKFMDPERVLHELGDTPGGVGPLHDDPVVTVLDDALVGLGQVTFGSGSPDRTIEMDADHLIELCGGRVGPVAKKASPA